MKPIREKDILVKIESLINEIKNDWSKYEPLSEWTRKGTINKLNKIKRMIKSLHIVGFKNSRELKFFKKNLPKKIIK